MNETYLIHRNSHIKEEQFYFTFSAFLFCYKSKEIWPYYFSIGNFQIVYVNFIVFGPIYTKSDTLRTKEIYLNETNYLPQFHTLTIHKALFV